MAEILNTIGTHFDAVRPFIGGLLCLIGALLCVVGTVGVLRFPDFYTRLHAASVTDTSGAFTLLAGMALMTDHWLILFKLLIILIFLLLTSPTASHAVANAAHTAGLEPIIGRRKQETAEEDA